MIHRKFDKIYTKQYIDEFLANLPNCDVEKALQELSYIYFIEYGKNDIITLAAILSSQKLL